MPPTGLGYLAQSLLEAGIEYAVEDLRVRGHLSALRKRIHTFQPDLIGLSLVSLEYNRSYKLICHVKEYYPQASIIVGGAHVSALGESVLEECDGIDFGVIGEGEGVLVALCRGETPLEAIPGLLYRQDGAVVSGPERELIMELDRIPFPRYTHFDLNRYAKEIPIITSRGCPYRCIFCPHSLM